jgi:hypothetical protein
MALRFTQTTARRRCRTCIQHRLFSDSSRNPANTNSSSSRPQRIDNDQTSLPDQSILSRITSYASQTAHRSLQKVKESAASNLNHTTNNLKETISSAAQSSKERIQHKSSQYASTARSSINNLGEQLKKSTVDNLQNTKTILKESLSTAAQSGKDRIKNELSSRLISYPSNNIPGRIADKTNNAIQQSSNATDLATRVIVDTTAHAANNVSSAVKESVSKASRWLWWWGLAAVGVYGMSTTLTKEGVQVLKDLIVGNKDDGGIKARSVDAPASNSAVEAESVHNGGGDTAAKGSWLSFVNGYLRNSRTGEE